MSTHRWPYAVYAGSIATSVRFSRVLYFRIKLCPADASLELPRDRHDYKHIIQGQQRRKLELLLRTAKENDKLANLVKELHLFRIGGKTMNPFYNKQYLELLWLFPQVQRLVMNTPAHCITNLQANKIKMSFIKDSSTFSKLQYLIVDSADIGPELAAFFFLPNIRETRLEYTAAKYPLYGKRKFAWPKYAKAGQSPITSFECISSLKAEQIMQILTWPKGLKRLVIETLVDDEYRVPDLTPAYHRNCQKMLDTPPALSKTLQELTFGEESSCTDTMSEIHQSKYIEDCDRLDLHHFIGIRKLRIAFDWILGNVNDTSHLERPLCQLLPPNIECLEIHVQSPSF